MSISVEAEPNQATELEELRTECAALRQKLTAAEELRDIYLRALYEIERNKHDFDDLDYDELMKEAAGPVEILKKIKLSENSVCG